MEAEFWSSEIVFFNESFILAGGNGFLVNCKHCAFIQSFAFCRWKPFLKLCVNQFSSVYSIPKSEAVFPASADGFFIEWFIPASGNGFSLHCSFIQSKFCAGGNHYSNWVKANFFEVTSLLRNHFLLVFFRYSCWWKQLFRVVETDLFNKSFILAG